MKTIRCSRLPLAIACPQSQDSDGIDIDGAGEAAALGTAVHEALASSIEGESPNVAMIAAKHGVDSTELFKLYSWGMKAWAQIGQWFPDRVTEEPMAAGILTGTCDVLSPGDGTDAEINIADFKSGWLDADCTHQVKGYAWLALQQVPEAQFAFVCVVRIRDGVVDRERYTRGELEQWYLWMAKRLAERSYNPGSHCSGCPRRATCPAIDAYLERAGNALVLNAESTNLLDPSSVVRIYAAAKQMEQLIEIVKTGVKARVAAAGGMLTTDAGTLVITESHQRKLVPIEALPVLRGYLSEDELTECIDLKKTKVEEAIKAKAPRGLKSSLVMDAMKKLDAAGAIRIQTIEKLERRNVRASTGAASSQLAIESAGVP